ncbi:TonB-dependent receptor family protein [Psychroflexus sp. ALD_RP9]|uniref:TonB-dependent receptor family protein n=1 Tax=Psychroflexus sp. ALD_RP9 TaxID=2777186 RepID=UPI001A8C729C|nr:TonB-dependent receptor [Psychroflexus sp. ALD_RP9]QSS97337.1 TonB-dependent receptor [Psychroflexus sp. ALD_RP9]
MYKIRFSLLLIMLTIVSFGQTQNQQNPQKKDSINNLSEVTIVANKLLGSKFEAKNRTGSAYFISKKDIQKFNYFDVNNLLGQVPGVNIYQEDGFGLRPNISLRGTSPERSSKITLMEDGVLIAPAPYSAPAAYYFPTISRMQNVEVLKGSSQIQYGPFTTGGAINFVSTEIPKDFELNLRANYGSYDTGNFYANIGDSKKNFGYLLEYNNIQSDGFKNLDNNGDTGFDINDFVGKFRVNTNPSAKVYHSLEFKFQYSDELSNETYLGLTQNDFNETPFRRYAGSQVDNMDTEHTQFMLTHTAKFSDFLRLTTTAYRNNFKRNWYKLDKVNFNNIQVGISDLLENPNQFPNHFSIVNGNNSTNEGALTVKNNNREYYSQGIQTKFDYHFFTGDFSHDLEVGLRYHQDEIDRFQWVDDYNMLSGNMNLVNQGIPGTESNRIQDAEALATYILYKLKFNKLTLTPGLRYESIKLTRSNYGTNDINRTGSDLSYRENTYNELIPGLGANYKINREIAIFGGIHKGFAPGGTQPEEEAEQSINYELGTRFNFNGFSGEIVGFFNDYSNLLGSDLNATGGTGSLEQFNAGEVNVAGFELLLNYNLLQNNSKFDLPLNFAYTYTDTEFQNNFESGVGIWGQVTAGDEMPYISKHQFNFGASFIAEKFQINANARYRGEFRTQAGTGSIPQNQKVDGNFVIDISGEYQLTNNFSLTANMINLLDHTYEVARVPAGLRPGHPFGIYGGFKFKL